MVDRLLCLIAPGRAGDAEGPYTRGELRELVHSGELREDLLVHEEEQGECAVCMCVFG